MNILYPFALFLSFALIPLTVLMAVIAVISLLRLVKARAEHRKNPQSASIGVVEESVRKFIVALVLLLLVGAITVVFTNLAARGVMLSM